LCQQMPLINAKYEINGEKNLEFVLFYDVQ
jgi:hypothetical protein